MKRTALLASAAVLAMTFAGTAYSETLKIAYIAPLSGSFANVGDQGRKHFV